MTDNDFFEVHAPCITFSDCEGAGEAFRVHSGSDLFGREAFLSVSAQLYAEAAASSLGRVFTFGPVFRAEKHNTSRHLAEFMMLEVELCFISEISQLMDFIETMLKRCIKNLPSQLLKPFGNEVNQRNSFLKDAPFTRLTYEQAIKLINSHADHHGTRFSNSLEWGMPLQTEHEKYLTESIVGGPTFVFNYPSKVKAFYMKSNGDVSSKKSWELSTVSCCDLLLPGVAEVVGGSIREDRLDVLEKTMEYNGLDPLTYAWYLDLRRFGSAPHGGFGIGFDRILQYLTATNNIRDVVLIPRTLGNSTC